MIELKKVNRRGEHYYVWDDPNGHEWRIYKSFDYQWRYIREDHDVSSTGYRTLESARDALERGFQNE